MRLAAFFCVLSLAAVVTSVNAFVANSASAEAFFIDLNTAYPVTMETMSGSWTGILPGIDAVLTLSFDDRKNRVLVAFTRGGAHGNQITVFEAYGIAGKKGRLMIGGPDAPILVDAEVWPVQGLGFGQGKFAVTVESRTWSGDVYLFRRREGSWLQWIVDLYSM